MLLIFLKIKEEWINPEKESFDVIGSIFYCLALVFIVYGASSLNVISASLGFLLIVLLIYNLGKQVVLSWISKYSVKIELSHFQT